MSLYTTTIYKDARGKHRWRITAPNHKIVGASSQGFRSRWICAQNLALLGRAVDGSDLAILKRANR